MNIKLKKINSCGMKVLTLLLSLFCFFQSTYAEELNPCDDNNIKFKAYSQGQRKPTPEWSSFVNSRSQYEKFVVELVNHVKGKLSNEPACKNETSGKPEISLTFVERHLPVYLNEWGRYKNESELRLKIDPNSLNNFSCQLSSPWLDMTIQRNPSLKISAVFNFEDRQFLIDQTLLTYPNLATTFKRYPLTDNLYMRYEKEYYKLFNRRRNSHNISNRTPEKAKNIPIDMLWIFNHTRFEKSAHHEVGRLVGARFMEYAKIAKALVSHCFASDQYEVQNFKTINELERFYGAKALNDYKIKSNYQIKIRE